ncbi:tetratricopeptide repeat protein, partial [Candidatus Poribacteria bacterium]|nr:tetratricopeptide repeat protein [Candidatus Poribacteria bacterium]
MGTAVFSSLEVDRLWDSLRAGDPAAVAARLGQSESLEPATLTLRGIARLDSGDPAGAVTDLTLVLRAEPENPVARLNRALAHFHRAEFQSAVADLTAGPIFPNADFVKRFLRTFWPVQFQHPELACAVPGGGASAEVAAPALARFGREPISKSQALRWSGELAAAGLRLAERRNMAGAARLFVRAQELDPGDSELRMAASWALLHTGHFAEAEQTLAPIFEASLAEFERSRALESLPPQHAISQYAWALHGQGRHDEALAVCATSRPEGPDDFHAHIVAAVVWITLGEREKAEVLLDRALGSFLLDTW